MRTIQTGELWPQFNSTESGVLVCPDQTVALVRNGLPELLCRLH